MHKNREVGGMFHNDNVLETLIGLIGSSSVTNQTLLGAAFLETIKWWLQT